jgi:DNA gyrase/topoisomerase IV subunit A
VKHGRPLGHKKYAKKPHAIKKHANYISNGNKIKKINQVQKAKPVKKYTNKKYVKPVTNKGQIKKVNNKKYAKQINQGGQVKKFNKAKKVKPYTQKKVNKKLHYKQNGKVVSNKSNYKKPVKKYTGNNKKPVSQKQYKPVQKSNNIRAAKPSSRSVPKRGKSYTATKSYKKPTMRKRR